ncbi:polysaccharide deacetylase family protein [Roseisalinus antarcticus]|uniref:Chitooligosaccharide deacetylase n=1 Tax=Roseisalinus antarcticus TaxID=254357 RepID=A0A1Y5TVL0_9RHOB|nr:polysaccharide deacetylase family protein [Roseisalinus antarcticus]SLN74330.1 Polysaccharide deacetylase [Roseisalinus antarcticus]
MIRLSGTIAEAVRDLSDGLAWGNAIRLVNYHSTPGFRAAEYEAQLAALAETHDGLDMAGMERLMQGEVPRRPVVVPVLFEGFRDNYDVILPMIERHGFTAWFFVPPAFLGIPVDMQRAFADRQTLTYPHDEYPGERIAMTWEELRDAHARGHVVACHSRTHTELTPETPEAILRDEIVLAKQEFDAALGAPVEIFCFLRGAEYGLNPRADAMLSEAGYRYIWSNFRVQKLP